MRLRSIVCRGKGALSAGRDLFHFLRSWLALEANKHITWAYCNSVLIAVSFYCWLHEPCSCGQRRMV